MKHNNWIGKTLREFIDTIESNRIYNYTVYIDNGIHDSKVFSLSEIIGLMTVMNVDKYIDKTIVKIQDEEWSSNIYIK